MHTLVLRRQQRFMHVPTKFLLSRPRVSLLNNSIPNLKYELCGYATILLREV
jgi:hypothetical protein